MTLQEVAVGNEVSSFFYFGISLGMGLAQSATRSQQLSHYHLTPTPCPIQPHEMGSVPHPFHNWTAGFKGRLPFCQQFNTFDSRPSLRRTFDSSQNAINTRIHTKYFVFGFVAIVGTFRKYEISGQSEITLPLDAFTTRKVSPAPVSVLLGQLWRTRRNWRHAAFATVILPSSSQWPGVPLPIVHYYTHQSTANSGTAVDTLQSTRPCSHLVPEHDYRRALMWTHRSFKDTPQNSGTVSVPEYKVETLYSGTKVGVISWVASVWTQYHFVPVPRH